MEKYGFVYIWRDRKHKRYYLGSHWGTETDGYICSSRWMRKAYRRRPEDFKRRILARISLTRAALYLEEERWIGMIKPKEFGVKYYNLKQGSTTHWTATENRKTIVEKLRGQKRSEEVCKKMRSLRLKYLEEHPEWKEEASNRTKELWKDGEYREKITEAQSIGMRGRWAKPEAHEKARSVLEELWEKGEYRESVSLGLLKYYEEHPEARETRSVKLREYCEKNPESRSEAQLERYAREKGETTDSRTPKQIRKSARDKERRTKEQLEKLENGWVKNLHPPHEKVECPHCGKIGGSSNMKRYHFDNCTYFE